MRPQVLFPLFAPVSSLKGVGPKLAGLIAKLAGERVLDLCFHFPTGVIDRSYRPDLATVVPGRVATLRITVGRHQPAAGPRQPHRVSCHDTTGRITLVYFNARASQLMDLLPPDAERVVSGTVDEWRGELQMTHPDHVMPPAAAATIPTMEPVYPLTAGLHQRSLQRAVASALGRLPDLPEWLEPRLLDARGWPSWRAAVTAAHAPRSRADLDPDASARERLAYDELLADQLATAIVRRTRVQRTGQAVPGPSVLAQQAEERLPFTLTPAQRAALAEIRADLASGRRMARLLQGDVGSGKTVVALLAMLDVVAAGGQAAMMAPTELLARQHARVVSSLAETVGVDVRILTGREKGSTREATLAGLADGTIPIVVGTHALFQDQVAFRNLLLTVVDEQHRFGVQQRTRLMEKGRAHLLVTTATPIPRTLVLTAYGDLDASRITGKPPGRKPVDTRVLPVGRIEDVVAGIRRATDRGAQAYWICPLVEESEASDLAAAEARHENLRARLGDGVGLLHGRMAGAEKDRAMADFAAGRTRILVATTVVEVGVDVPAATIMVIEHADRFGLAQLHQLRGRVGRGDDASTCILLYAPPLGETARARLETMRRTDDGFEIAEEDLRLRGAGEVLGTRQSGLPGYRLADLEHHRDLAGIARDDALVTLERDPDLTTPRGEALRILLYLFERDTGVRYLRSG